MFLICNLSFFLALPSAELVSRVRNLYAKRVSDVRFLIPVLNGLAKVEIIAAVPKLIKLNPNVVKEVYQKSKYSNRKKKNYLNSVIFLWF